jgi:hypothetical protein
MAATSPVRVSALIVNTSVFNSTVNILITDRSGWIAQVYNYDSVQALRAGRLSLNFLVSGQVHPCKYHADSL